jgi:hypothetical protein
MAGVPASSFWDRGFRDRSDEECVELPVQELLDLLGYPEPTPESRTWGQELFNVGGYLESVGGESSLKRKERLVEEVEEERDLKIRRALKELRRENDDDPTGIERAQKMARTMPDRWWENTGPMGWNLEKAELWCITDPMNQPRSHFCDISCYQSQQYEKGLLHMTSVAFEFILAETRDREYKVGCTADFIHRWYEKAIGGYIHDGYERMYILWLTDRGRCKNDKTLEIEIPNPVDRQHYKDKDRSAGRMENRLFHLLREHGEGERGFLNAGEGGEGLAKENRWTFVYLSVKREGTMLDRFIK